MKKLDFTDPASLEALTDMLVEAGVSGVEITTPDAQVRLVVGSPSRTVKSSSRATQRTASADAVVPVKAPIAGHFRARVRAQGDDLPVPVEAGEVIGLIRIGHVLIPAIAHRAGRLVRQLAQEEALVGFGDPLFEIEPQS